MAKREVYEQIHEGDWVPVVKRGYHVACCDCCLVHVLDHRTDAKGRIEVRYKVNRRATAALRRAFKFTKESAD